MPYITLFLIVQKTMISRMIGIIGWDKLKSVRIFIFNLQTL